MLINCVAYPDGKRLGDSRPDEIHRYLSRPGCFVWVALRDRDAEALALMQAQFDLHPLAFADAKRGRVANSFDVPAPVSGVVTEKLAVEGMMMRMGEPFYRLADLSSIWVIADVAEQDLGQVKIGTPARVSFTAFAGEVFEGRVTFVLHELEMATRTAKVRIE